LSLCASQRAQVCQADLSGLYDRPIVDFDFRSAYFSSENIEDIEQPVEVPEHGLVLEGGPGSMSLCLYALMGLGLCSAPHWIKRISFGHIPEWYHGGGPFQIGHSYAATPKSLCTLQVCCYLPPDVPVEDPIPRYCLGIIVSCWRKSQFTPDVIASRGPPLFS